MKTTRKTDKASTSNGKTRAVAYLRVSTQEQADHGVSLDAQRAKVAAYAALYDLDLVAVEVDAGASAKSLDGRPALARALSMLDGREADALIVVKLDRLTRNVADLGGLVERYFGARGAALLSVGEQIDTRTSAGRLVLNVLASVAQWEREAIGERTSAALQHKKANGERVGAVDFGYRLAADGVRLEADAGEQATIARARTLAAGGLSLRKVAAALEGEGLTARNGKAFAATQIARMVG